MLALPAFIVVISVIIVVHELGHYWVARLFNTKVDAFSIGFGPRLFGWIDKAGTEWKVCALPIGGYVQFHGDASAASVPDREKLEEIKRSMAAEGTDPHRILHFKPLYQRALVVFAGPFANFVLALVLLTGFLMFVGEPYQPIIVKRVLPDSPAQAAGLKAGDQIVAADGWKLFTNNDLVTHVSMAADEVMTLEIRRDGHMMDLTVRPASRMITLDNMGRAEKMRGGRIGAELKIPTAASLITYHHSPFSAVKRGVDIISTLVRSTFWFLGDLVTGQAAPNMVGGPLRIAQMSGQVAQSGLVNLIAFIALISVSVGLVNLFPIPILDGGHLLFYAIEAIQGRPLSHRVQEIGFRIGLAVIALTFVFLTWNDILYLLPGRHSGAP